MDRNQQVEVMPRTTEDLQMLLMEHPYEDLKLSDVNLIKNAMIKLSKCGGLYTKAIERWQSKTKEDKNIWAHLCKNLIAEYENMLG